MKHFIQPAVLFSIITGCAGAAGVAPENKYLEIRSCVLDDKTVSRSDKLSINTAECESISFKGPLSIPANKKILIKNAKDLVVFGALHIDGSLTIESDGKAVSFREPKDAKEPYIISVSGQLVARDVNFSGPAHITFGSESAAPKSIELTKANFVASPNGAPELTFYGDSVGCSESESTPTYKFTEVTVSSLKDDALNLFNIPSDMSGIEFSPTASGSVLANLGDLCVGKNKTFNLASSGLTYSAQKVTVLGTLNLSAKQFTITGDEPLTVDGGVLNSQGSKTDQNVITFASKGSAKNKKIIAKNGAALNLSRSTIQNGSITANASKVTMDKSKIVSACYNPDVTDCASAADKAAIVLENKSKADLNETELQPKVETQILVVEDEGEPSEVLARGNPEDYKARTSGGHVFNLHHRLYVQLEVPVEKHVADQLTELNGTYEGPCIKGENSETSSYRRRFTYDNQFVVFTGTGVHHNAAHGNHNYLPTKLQVWRTILTYEGGACQKLISTSHYIGQANFFVSQDNANSFRQRVLNDVFYDLKHTYWTYHNANMISTLNEQKVCGLDTWTIDVAQNITNRECYGTRIRFEGFFDRFERLENGNLYLSMDYEDRPDNLMDLVPQDVYRGFEFIKIR